MQKLPAVIESLTTERLLTVILFIALMLGISGYSSDVFLHLATGKYIVTAGSLPTGDPFSFTRPGVTWVMHEWLSQIWLYLIYAGLGFAGLKVLGATVLTATLYINTRSCNLLGARPMVSWAITILLFLTWLEFIGVRPHTITYLFFVVTLHALLRYRQQGSVWMLYAIPIIMPVWVNSHGGFIVGLVLVGYFLVLHTVEARRNNRAAQWPWPLVVTLLLSLCTSLLNPYGYEQLLFPFRMMNQWALGYVTEWQPMDLHQWNNVLYLVGVVAFLVTLMLPNKNERTFRIFLALPFFMASLQSIRHLPLSIFVITPFLASQVSQLIEDLKQHRLPGLAHEFEQTAGGSGVARRDMGSLEYIFNWIIFGSICLALYLTYPAYVKYASNSVHKNFPIDATRYLIEHHMEGRMFTTMEFSTYILFTRSKEQKLFYDVRVEMYGDALARDYITMAYALDGWQKMFEKYAIDYAVLDKSRPIYAAVISDDRFTQVYEDETSAIFLVKHLQ